MSDILRMEFRRVLFLTHDNLINDVFLFEKKANSSIQIKGFCRNIYGHWGLQNSGLQKVCMLFIVVLCFTVFM